MDASDACIQQYPSFKDQLPATRGIVTENAPLAGIGWFRTGGNAEVLFQPSDTADLRSFLRELDPRTQITVLGLGSNTLIRDGGVPGIVIQLGKNFNKIVFDGDDILAGAGALDATVSRACRDHSIAGLEFPKWDPRYDWRSSSHECRCLRTGNRRRSVSARAIDRNGQIHEVTADDFGFTYRHVAIKEIGFFYQRECADQLTIGRKLIHGCQRSPAIASVRNQYKSKLVDPHLKNPAGTKAWKLIDAAGCRGLAIGDAVVSEQHSNFISNLSGNDS